MEKELFVRLALCVDPRKAEAAGLSRKAVKSLGVGVPGISAEERQHRHALKKKILKNAEPYKPGTEIFPGLGPHPGFPPYQQLAIPHSRETLEASGEKDRPGVRVYARRKEAH